jgi:putative copper export protein
VYELLLLLHVLGATVWTGGHLVLALTVLPRALRQGAVEELRRCESGYERIGIPALLVQVATGVLLARRWSPDAARWFDLGDPVGRLVGLKLLLLAATLALALDARLRLIPRLHAGSLRALAWHIVPVTAISVLYVVVGVSFRTGWLS